MATFGLLLASQSLPIEWSAITPDLIDQEMSGILADAQRKIDDLCALKPEECTYDSVFFGLEKATEDLEYAWGKIDHLTNVADSPGLRVVHDKWLPEVTRFTSSLTLSEPLWRVVKAASKNTKKESVHPHQWRFLKETLQDFEDNGANLPEEKKAELKAIEEELARLSESFSKKVLDATNAWELIVTNEKELAGLPSSAMAMLRESARKKNLGESAWRITLQQPSRVAILTYADNDDLRKKVWEAASRIGRDEPYRTIEIIQKILSLRAKKAKLLGKAHYPDLILKRRMAESGQKALAFVTDMKSKVQTAFKRDYEILKELKAKKLGTSVQPLSPWEIGYWAEKDRQMRFDFDGEQLRPYFEVNATIHGLFSICERLFGLSIREIDLKSRFKWSSDIKYYVIEDTSTKKIKGYFYSDLHPRDSKRAGAWLDPLLSTALSFDGTQAPKLGVICGNMTEATPDTPALLTHDEVQTIFHEFGHLLHHLLGETYVRSLSGINVLWDFVEMPSQLMENFCWERETLDLFAKHYQTGEKIPDELFAKMLQTRAYGEGIMTMRQMAFAYMDLKINLEPEIFTTGDFDSKVDALLADYSLEYSVPTPNIAPAFSHIFAGAYGAGYYSYSWAEVLDADAFTRFEDNGILNPTIGGELRKKILEKGNSVHPMELFVDFMGRAPDPTALLKRKGLGV
jgi:oligopeptidase A